MTSTIQTVAARQPFAPIDRFRLHRLRSIKNSQNGQNALPSTPTALKLKAAVFEANNDSIPTAIKRKTTIFAADDDSSPTATKRRGTIFKAKYDSKPTAIKRKAAIFEADGKNSENIDPASFASPKRVRSKEGLALTNNYKTTTTHPVLTKAPSSWNEIATWDPVKQVISDPIKSVNSNAIHPIKSVNSRPIDPIESVNSNAINPIKSVKSNAIDPIKSFNSNAINPIKSVNSNTINPIKSVNSHPIDPIKSVNSHHIDPIKSVNSRPIISRPVIHPQSPASKLNKSTSVIKTSTISLPAPAGRSPIKKQRIGILNPRHTNSPITRIDPLYFTTGGSVASVPISTNAALCGTVHSHRRRTRGAVKVLTSLHQPLVKASWFFDIHEESAEEAMTNLMEHSTSVLDINNDDESRQEGRGKENEPPTNDVSQTSSKSPRTHSFSGEPALQAGRRRRDADPDAIEVGREALGDLEPRDFYPEGVSEKDVVYVWDDEEDEEKMEGPSSEAGHAAFFEPLEKAEEGFEIWESESAKSEAEGDN